MLLPIGFLVGLLTFPGVLVHETAHLFFCRAAGLEVHDYRLLRFGNPMGYVIHETPERLRDALAVTVAPAIINSVGAVLLVWPIAYLGRLADPNGATTLSLSLQLLAVWLGISLGAHAFPSLGDANSLWRQVRSGQHGVAGYVLGIPVAGLILLGSVAAVFWLDILYGYVLAMIGMTIAVGGGGIGGTIGFLLAGAFVFWVGSIAFPGFLRRPPAGGSQPVAAGHSTLLAAEDTPAACSPTAVQAGWYPDPSGRHSHRYWDGAAWTGNVADNGIKAIDPLTAN